MRATARRARRSRRCRRRRACYVAAVVVAGAVCLVVAAMHLHFEHPILFGVLMALAVVTSAAKIDLPLGRSQSNLSLSHAVNFWALFALGPGGDRLHRRRRRLGAVHAARGADAIRCIASSSASPR